ncbi:MULTISPECIES: glycosyltransferase family 4 protein [unclassified Xanthomonas]|uniref:glycosyltransferase family 4 protein n=1 Tax=Xanthomonas sp. LMG 8992 TaxID=1591157 RepID=UPI001617CAF6|nr:glycosyltransferase family 4 protein [Xanthomonas sp. LMG 8992]
MAGNVARAVHAVQLNFVPLPDGVTPEQAFALWPSLADIAEAVASAGTRVSVIQAAAVDAQLQRNGVSYHFVRRTDAGRRRHLRRIAALLAELDADVVHVHGLQFAREAATLARWRPSRPILLQDHANRPPRWWRRPQWRRWYAAAAGIAFTSLDLARGFVGTGLFAGSTRLFAIPESSCRFTPGERDQARRDSGLHGAPCVLWVGHLSEGKDPLTVLDGVARASVQLPGMQLFCAFGDAPLLPMVQQRIQADPRLAGRVHLLGRVEHAQIQTLMRAADLFVSGSLGESCGYAALEAYACGAVPVLTDIPAFRALSDGGRIGALWPCGDAERLAAALLQASRDGPSRALVRAHFDAQLSFAAVGRRWARAYAQLLGAAPRSAA